MENSNKHFKSYVLDRYEGEYAILEDKYGRNYDVLREELPEDIREGDILSEDQGSFVIDEEATKIRREELQHIREALTR